MWEKLHPSAAQVFSRTPTLQVTWLTPKQRRCVLCILGSHTFVPISWNCKKQTAVSHSSTEAYLLGRWSKIGLNSFAQVVGHGSWCVRACSWEKSHAQQQTQEDEITHGGQEGDRQHWFCSFTHTLGTSFRFWRQRTMRWSSARINVDPGIQINYVNTSKQIAGILTTGSFSRESGHSCHSCHNCSISRHQTWEITPSSGPSTTPKLIDTMDGTEVHIGGHQSRRGQIRYWTFGGMHTVHVPRNRRSHRTQVRAPSSR